MRAGSGVAVDACILNRAVTEAVTPTHRRFMAALLDPEYEVAVSTRLGGSPELLEAGLDLEARLYDTSSRYAKLLRSRLPMPVVPIPFIVDRPGLTTTRAVADALGAALE
jgi:hypothetical protein